MIFHLDMDAFFAAVEQRDRPELRGKPVLIGGSAKRGVVATASYEARPFGPRSAMPMAQALRLCPEAIVVKPRMARYAEVSRQIMSILRTFTPIIEPLSLDEAFMDMSQALEQGDSPRQTALCIKRAIWEATALTGSVGIANNKFLAKLASDMHKPDGLTFVEPGTEREVLTELDVQRIWGVGPKTAQKLRRLKLFTIGDVAHADRVFLEYHLGTSLARHIYQLAQGIDARPVKPYRERKSLGSETTLADNIHTLEQVDRHLQVQCERVAQQLQHRELKARGLRVKLRYAQTFQLVTRQGVLPRATHEVQSLGRAARRLLYKFDLPKPIRLVGATAYDLLSSTNSNDISDTSRFQNGHRISSKRQLDLFNSGSF